MNEPEPREIRELRLLYRLSRILGQSLDLLAVLRPAIEALARHMGLEHGSVTILDESSGEIAILVAHGTSPRNARRLRYQVGEGITGRVVASGEPIVVPRTDESVLDPGDGFAAGGPLSALCVPLKSGPRVFGALAVDRRWTPETDLDEDLRLLSIVGSLIAQAADLRRRAGEEQERLASENRRLRAELQERFRPSNIVGTSPGMRVVYDDIATVSTASTTVLIEGESGTGKELVAQAIHYNSPRAVGPFVKVHCGALPESVIESELFGHVRGAFTGAVSDRQGRFELAHSGTLFLDEVGDIPPSIQIKLLRVLQERELEKVGTSQAVTVDVRLIAATNRDLTALVEQGRFREDLYYRLCVFPIRVPPLRQRKTDIPLLVEHFLSRLAAAAGRPPPEVASSVLDMFASYHWPGNVRELEACLERALLLVEGEELGPQHLPPTLQTAETTGTGPPGSLRALVEAYERDLLAEALRSTGGNMAAAARSLGSSQRVVSYKALKYGLVGQGERAPGSSSSESSSGS